jgi:hypothetical protein
MNDEQVPPAGRPPLVPSTVQAAYRAQRRVDGDGKQLDLDSHEHDQDQAQARERGGVG